jgi:hypothetical protein
LKHLIKKSEECGEVWSGLGELYTSSKLIPSFPLPPKGQSSRAGAACVLAPLLWMVVLGNL